MKRRDFIQKSSLGLGLVSNMQLDKMQVSSFQPATGAYEENDNILVVVQLFGGNDGINTITPYEWDKYYTLYRPKLNIPASAVTPISKEKGMAMHPNLRLGVKDGMHGLFKSGKLSIISGVGYDNPNYSHFRSTDIWLSGIVPANDSTPLRTGWLGRYFDKYDESVRPESPFCIQVGQNPSLMFLGDKTEKSIVLESADELFNQAKAVESTKVNIGGGENFLKEFAYVNEIGVKVNDYSKVIKKAFDSGKNMETYYDKTLSNQLKLVARLIDGGLKSKVYFVELKGFDTHSAQGGLDGLHSKLLAEMSEAISSFQSDIEKLGHSKKVLGITASEFGRRPYENGSLGTDHGTSNFLFAFGDSVKPEILGTHISFLTFRDHQNLNFTTDFRSIYFEVLVSWFGQTVDQAAKIMGGKFAYAETVGFIKTTKEDKTLPPPPVVPVANNDPNSPVNPNNPANITEQDKFIMFPNPVGPEGTFVNMTLYFETSIEISQVSLDGKVLGKLHVGKYRAGRHNVFLDLKGGPGPYIILIQAGRRYHSLRCIKM